MDPGQVSAGTRRTCMVVAVLGALLVMVGFTAQVVANGLPGVGVVAWGLVAGGLFCGSSSSSPAAGRPTLAVAGGRLRRPAGP